MSLYRYFHLDVFAASHGGGNHLGVVVGADDWTEAAMQRFARWTNLVETCFLLKPTDADASYRVRMFTPHREIDFAGHPSLGSAHAALVAGVAEPVDGRLVQECRAGLIAIRVLGRGSARQLMLKAPQASVLAQGADAAAELPAALAGLPAGRLSPALVDGGRRWWVVEGASEAAVRGWHPDHEAIRTLAKASQSMGVCVFARAGEGDSLVVRAFAGGAGIVEDPASGAANGLVGAYLAQVEPEGTLAGGYAVSQGREMGYDARLVVHVEHGQVWVGGRTNTVIDGQVDWTAQQD
ncbi:PhzF family phenazine biosynthesis protein [Oleiagrimonas sp. C23AA]|uniref:PhzF family phenazine biosynthesis protein n=1 Tax=Oleiagrimonas sp. C23AA TaxID=2719047 RepID=UPI00141E9A6E|nr:PhzF family phenazine biosynthesis protein [Oleiagrimonas sp. C23AA]NII12356.1 PhzF family phenazine biosynthesis protein [Oleiagrimonas sp. C23AA]